MSSSTQIWCLRYSYSFRLNISNIPCSNDATNLFRDAPVPAERILQGGEVDILCCPGPLIQIHWRPSALRVIFSLPLLSLYASSEAADISSSLNGCSKKGAWSFICSEASPLLTPPSAHVAPAAAPALSNSDTAFPFFCHIITLPPTILVIFAPPLHITSKKKISFHVSFMFTLSHLQYCTCLCLRSYL